jgi:MoaA/NifB/PqqE/SkfB family radical SAM enzyme
MADEQKNFKASLHRDVLFKAVKDCNRYDVKLIHFSGGGEPTLHPDLLETMKLCKEGEPKLEVVVSTNGIKLKPEMVKFADDIRISLNAGTIEMYEKITNLKDSNSWSVVLNNIVSAIAYRNARFVKCNIGIAFVITPDNWPDLDSFCRLGRDLGVDFAHIRPAIYPKGDPRNVAIKKLMPEAVSIYEKCTKLYQTHKFTIFFITEKFEGYWTPRTYNKCRATPLQAVLTATGEFIICQDVFIRFGNYNKEEFWDIWGKDKHRAAIEKIDMDLCPRCVENKHNEIIEYMFAQDKARLNLI